MKIAINGFELEVDVPTKVPIVICIENVKVFRSLISNQLFAENIEGLDLKLQINEQLISPRKMKIFVNYFDFTLNEKQFILKLFEKLEKELMVEHDSKIKIENYLNMIKEILDEQVLKFDVDIIVSNPSLNDIFKFFQIKFQENKQNALELLYNYIDILSEFRIYEVLVFVNLFDFFSKNEILSLWEYLSYHDIRFVCIESHKHDKISNEIIYHIDENLFEYCY